MAGEIFKLVLNAVDDGYEITPTPGWAAPGAFQETHQNCGRAFVRLHVLFHALEQNLNLTFPLRPEPLPMLYQIEPFVYVTEAAPVTVIIEPENEEETFDARWGVIKDPTRTANGKIHYMVVVEIEGYREPVQIDVPNLRKAIEAANTLYELNESAGPNWPFDDDLFMPE